MPPPTEDHRGDSQRTVGTSLLLGGGAVTVVGLVFGGLALSKWNTVSDACPDRLCDTTQERAAVQGDARTADRFAVVSTVTIGIGLVAIAAGLVLRMTSPSASSALTSTLGGRGLVLGTTFR